MAVPDGRTNRCSPLTRDALAKTGDEYPANAITKFANTKRFMEEKIRMENPKEELIKP